MGFDIKPMTTPKHYPLSEFKPLTEELLRLVWQWRNQSEIRRNMHNDAPISWDEHLSWFSALKQNSKRRFLVFFQDGRPIGVLNFSTMTDGVLEWGCYLGETDVWPGSGLLLEIAALDYASSDKTADTLYAEVLSFNQSVIKMHQLFGYQQMPEKPGATRENEAYQVKVFTYPLTAWRINREAILAKLPKQIAAAAARIQFY